MADHGIDVYDFVQWAGPAPTIPQQKIVASNRAGAYGVTIQLVGKWGESFEVTLTSHYASMTAAAVAFAGMSALCGTGPKFLKYANINYTGLYSTGYNVSRVDQVSLQKATLLVGPGYAYSNGCIMVTRWTLYPEEV
jgi:hypothetical protein